ncbi:helix-turn-helix domain-containing protein [Chloroflexus sp.]|uniref:helix-turn-helix domain-containing protein n=1 Tax=Chloroflexus sp. TaxID=1904827 RepID=UPI002ACDDFCD|nr:helix-turn-helix domain-containing protein [Chloroflexus sp.]
MADWVTVDEAVTLLAERGVTVISKGQENPPSRPTVISWCQKGLLKAERKGAGKRGIWLIDRDALMQFTPPKTGRPPAAQPTPAALAQRESRRRRHTGAAGRFVAVTGDKIDPDVGETTSQIGETPAGHAALDLRGVPCPICEKRGLHYPKKPGSQERDASRVRCRFCGRVSEASELAPYVATYHELQQAEAALKHAEAQVSDEIL